MRFVKAGNNKICRMNSFDEFCRAIASITAFETGRRQEMDHRTAVLVVEDEPLIRMAIVSELEDAGFAVFEAGNADAAIVILLSNSKIAVMFTDVDMPGGIDGLKLAAAVRDRWPPIKIIVTSGYHNLNNLTMPVDGRFLRKPYNTTEVIEAINEMFAA